MDYMDMWARSMRSDNNKLGYPERSIGISSGGDYTSFDEMVEEADSEIIKNIDAVVSSLPKDQRDAVWARWLRTKKPSFYEWKLEMAVDNLLTILGRRLGI